SENMRGHPDNWSAGLPQQIGTRSIARAGCRLTASRDVGRHVRRIGPKTPPRTRLSGMEVPEANARYRASSVYSPGNLRLGFNELARFPAFQHSQCRATNMRNGLTNVKSFFASVQ